MIATGPWFWLNAGMRYPTPVVLIDGPWDGKKDSTYLIDGELPKGLVRHHATAGWCMYRPDGEGNRYRFTGSAPTPKEASQL